MTHTDQPQPSRIEAASDCPGLYHQLRAQAGDLGDAQSQQLRTHIRSCRACRRDSEALDEAMARHKRERPAAKAVASIFEAARSRTRQQRLVLILAPVAAVLLLLATWALWPAPPAPASGIRTKGAFDLSFYVMRGADTFPGRSGDAYRAGDRFQFVYSSGAQGFLFLVSLDTDGRVFNFNYRRAAESVPIEPGVDRILEGSIILDDSLAAERVFALFSDQPLGEREVFEAARQTLAELSDQGRDISELDRLPLDLPQASILIFKDDVR